jgi:bifunctional enzyme CysN/CysC
VWMHTEAMELDRPYLVKHTTQQVRANITQLHHRVNINDLSKIPADTLELNEIGVVSLETHHPLFFDAYRKNRGTGAFILIDPVSNLTVAAGMIAERVVREDRSRKALSGVEFERSRLTAAERWERAGHRPATIWLTARTDVAYLLERELFDRGCMVHVLADDVESHFLPELAKISAAAGLITICTIASDEDGERDRARELVGPEHFIDIEPQSLSAKDIEAKDQITSLLESRGFVRPDDRGIGGDGI